MGSGYSRFFFRLNGDKGIIYKQFFGVALVLCASKLDGIRFWKWFLNVFDYFSQLCVFFLAMCF